MNYPIKGRLIETIRCSRPIGPVGLLNQRGIRRAFQSKPFCFENK